MAEKELRGQQQQQQQQFLIIISIYDTNWPIDASFQIFPLFWITRFRKMCVMNCFLPSNNVFRCVAMKMAFWSDNALLLWHLFVGLSCLFQPQILVLHQIRITPSTKEIHCFSQCWRRQWVLPMLTCIVSKMKANSAPMWLVTFSATAYTIIVIHTKHTYFKKNKKAHTTVLLTSSFTCFWMNYIP